MTFDTPTNAGKSVMSNNASARKQQYTKHKGILIGPNDIVCYDIM